MPGRIVRRSRSGAFDSDGVAGCGHAHGAEQPVRCVALMGAIGLLLGDPIVGVPATQTLTRWCFMR